jgi:hypothetical protein
LGYFIGQFLGDALDMPDKPFFFIQMKDHLNTVNPIFTPHAFKIDYPVTLYHF